MFNNVYTCDINSVTVSDDYNQNINIVGGHPPGWNNNLVRAVRIQLGDIPFIIPQLFTTFPNLFRLTISNAGLRRIQSHALANATNLELMIVESNPLREIEANAFSGASSLRSLDLFGNQLLNIDEDAFVGLSNLRDLLLESNRIRHLRKNLFRPLKTVEIISLSDNNVDIIHENLFANNRHLRNIDLVRNRINEVGRNFIEGLNELQILNVFENRCVNNIFIVDDTASKEEIRNGLTACFDNFDSTVKLKMEVRGSFTISDDYGNEMLSL